MDDKVHGLVADEGLAGVEHAVVLTIVAPAVLDHVVFVAHLALGVVEDLHHLIEGDVVALSMTPVVLDLEGDGKALVEGVMGVGGDAHIVIDVDAEALVEALRSVFLAVVVELPVPPPLKPLNS